MQPCYGKAETSSTLPNPFAVAQTVFWDVSSQHRVPFFMKGLCRTANSCKPGLVVGALRIACDGLCTAAMFHTAEDNPGCRWKCLEELDCLRHYNCCPILFDHLNSLWPGTNECISSMAIETGKRAVHCQDDRRSHCVTEQGFHRTRGS